ncbi:MAG TPA: SRPBCC family protein [Ignavibacteriaceae bacterium]|nr:SRPBCC family protein [Ignavibacteriaceae bacterium]
MEKTIKISATFNTSLKTIYEAWLDSEKHSAFTGGKAKINPKVGGKFKVWDGYISGRNLELEPYKRIVQSWRTTEFPDDAPDSLLEIFFSKNPRGTMLTLIHSKIPDGQSDNYKNGWKEFYFKPMKKYFLKK